MSSASRGVTRRTRSSWSATGPRSRSSILRHCSSWFCLLHLLVQRAEYLGHLLVDDRLQHTLPHRRNRSEVHVGSFPMLVVPFATSLRLNEVSMPRRPTLLPFA